MAMVKIKGVIMIVMMMVVTTMMVVTSKVTWIPKTDRNAKHHCMMMKLVARRRFPDRYPVDKCPMGLLVSWSQKVAKKSVTNCVYQ